MTFAEFVNKWIGTHYSLHNTDTTLNCWGIVAQWYATKDVSLKDYSINNTSPSEICSVFTTAFAKGDHGFKKCEEDPKDGDVVVFKSGRGFHVGLYYKGKVLHSSARTFGVALQEIKDIHGYKEIEFWELK